MTKKSRNELIAILVVCQLLLTGCGTKTEKEVVNTNNDITLEQLSEQTGVPKEEIVTIVKETVEETKTETVTPPVVKEEPPKTTPTTVESKEETVVRYFETKETEIETAAEKTKTTGDEEGLKEKATEYLKTAVDFLFYDKEINGITFDELSNEAKAQILDSVDDTKDILKDSGVTDISVKAWQDGKEWTIDTFGKAVDITNIALKDLMGEKAYEKATDIVDEAQDRIGDTVDDIKEYLKTR